jgi:hypothetical protein
MIQIKAVPFTTNEELEASVNAFLSGIDSDAFRSIEVKEGLALILYNVKEAWKDRMCSECQFWDDSGSADAVSGLCQEHGN